MELHGCDGARLDDFDRVRGLMLEAASAAGATVVNEVFHRFSPQGVTGVVVVEESHLSIHTWPEHGYAAVDFFTCGDCVPERAKDVLRAGLLADRADVLTVVRGVESAQPSMRLEPPRSEVHVRVARAAVAPPRPN